MGVFIDIDADHPSLHIDSVIDSVRSQTPTGNHRFRYCQMCGNEIPEQRRTAIPGVMRCVECVVDNKAKQNVKNSECTM